MSQNEVSRLPLLLWNLPEYGFVSRNFCACTLHRSSRARAEENVEISSAALEVLSQVAGGDMRKAITTLQSAVRLKGSPVDTQAILDVAGAVPRDAAANLLDACRSGIFETLQVNVEDLIAAGYPAQDLLTKFQEVVIDDPEMSESARGRILIRLAEADKDLIDGADETLQIMATAAYAQEILLEAAS